MPCLGPLTLRQQLRLIRSLMAANARATFFEASAATWRRRTGWASAVAAGFLLVGPAALTHEQEALSEVVAGPPVVALGQCPTSPEGVTANVGSPDGGIARGGKLPAKIPETWMRAPCPEGQNMRTIRGHCFVATGQRPPCSMGHEESGECLLALTGAQPTPNSFEP